MDANVDLNYWFGEYPGNNNYYTGWRSENGRDYWYENGVKQGTQAAARKFTIPAATPGTGWMPTRAVPRP